MCACEEDHVRVNASTIYLLPQNNRDFQHARRKDRDISNDTLF